MAAALIADFEALPARERNVPRMVFLDRSARELYPEWDAVAAESVDYLRMYAGRAPDDPELTELVGELSIHSPDFRELWARHDVVDKGHGTKILRHPVVGEITITYATLQLPGDTDQLLVTYTVEPGSPSEQNLRLLASWAAPDRENSRFVPREPRLP
ncbi:hypothetical protein [Kribbella sp. NPDC048915]|uniref:MmyB family transcriptional regulator n=1 Tax=Kribbella sp. NPDC048915 TaxID=3155148 RepID=UPI0033E5563C